MSRLGLWASAAQRYRAEVELRTQPLGARFWCRFVDGALVLRMANGVERSVGRDELRAAFRVLGTDAPRETLRMVTAHGPYLAAVREDLGLHGYDPGSLEVADEEDEGALEAILLEEARAHTRPATGPAEEEPAEPVATAAEEDQARVLLRELASEKAAKEELVRQHSQSRAEAEDAKRLLSEANTRLAELEAALAAARQARPSKPANIGTRTDWGVLAALARSEVASLPPSDHRRAIEKAADNAASQPRLAAVECREALEALALAQYVTVFHSEPSAYARGHADLMNALRGLPGIDDASWHLRKTLYSQLSDVVHGRRPASPRTACVMLLWTAIVAAELTA